MELELADVMDHTPYTVNTTRAPIFWNKYNSQNQEVETEVIIPGNGCERRFPPPPSVAHQMFLVLN